MNTKTPTQPKIGDRRPAELDHSELLSLSMIANGDSADTICRELSISSRELALLLFQAQRKLGAENLLHAVSKAMSQGLIPI